MGMSTHVTGFRPADETWRKMKAVWDACEEAGTEIPKEVATFFGDEEPDEAGVELEYGALKKAGAVREWDDGVSCNGYEILVDKIPPDVKIVRVYNSY
jgi:hypothetical protein